MSNLPNPQLGDVVAEAIHALTFGGQVPIAEIPRDRAERLLSSWALRLELSDRDCEAVLAQFPDRVADAREAYAIGYVDGVRQRLNAHDGAQIGLRLPEVGDSCEQAYANGFVDALNRADPSAVLR